jgi:hypothetical protein
MKHWKTKEEMGSGFQHTEKQHKEFEYNSLEKIKPYEKNTMRTHYLIRDVWSNKQLRELKEYIDDVLEERV